MLKTEIGNDNDMNKRDGRESPAQSLRIRVTLGELCQSLMVFSESEMACLLAVERPLPSPHNIEFSRLLISACLSAARFQDLFASILSAFQV